MNYLNKRLKQLEKLQLKLFDMQENRLDTDYPNAGMFYPPPVGLSRQTSGARLRQNSSNRLILTRDNTREDKLSRTQADK